LDPRGQPRFILATISLTKCTLTASQPHTTLMEKEERKREREREIERTNNYESIGLKEIK